MQSPWCAVDYPTDQPFRGHSPQRKRGSSSSSTVKSGKKMEEEGVEEFVEFAPLI